MLQIFHEHIKGWAATLIITLIALSFLIGSLLLYAHPGSPSGTIATVNNRDISLQDMQMLSERLRQAYNLKTGKTLTDAEAQQLNGYALQALITKDVLLDTATQIGFRIPLDQTI